MMPPAQRSSDPLSAFTPSAEGLFGLLEVEEAGAPALEVAKQVIDSLVMARFAAPAGAPIVALPQRHYPTLPRRKTG